VSNVYCLMSASLTREQALDCLASDDLIGLGMEADALRRSLHPEGVVTYALARNVAWPADTAALDATAREALASGASSLAFTGPVPTQPLEWFTTLLRHLRARFPALAVSAFAPADLLALQTPLTTLLPALREAGLSTLSADPGPSLPLPEFLSVHRAAHAAGLQTTAAVTFGAEDTTAFLDRVLAIRALQGETHGFLSLLPIAFQPGTEGDPAEPTAVEMLKTLAVCRVLAPDIPHLQAHAPTQGNKVLQMALRFGADDAGSLPLPERRPAAHSAQALTEEELRRTIRDAGFLPLQRDATFSTLFMV